MYINEADSYFDEITQDDIVTDDEAKQMDKKIYPVLEYVNDLIDIQTAIGARETKGMIVLLNKFSNFMIGAIALAIALLGSIIYDMFKKPEVKKVVKKPIKKAVPKKKSK